MKIEETELIRIKTIKRKHAEQILESVGSGEPTPPADCDLLYYMAALDAILARRKDNGHLVAIPGVCLRPGGH